MWQKIQFGILIILVMLMTILFMQNWTMVELKIFFWPFKAALSLHLLFSFLLGLGAGWTGHIAYHYARKKATTKSVGE